MSDWLGGTGSVVGTAAVGGGGYGSFGAYGSLNLTETSPQQSWTEPLSLDEVKSYLKVPFRSPVDTDEDAELEQLITAAREQAEILQSRDLVQKQWDLAYDYWPSYRVELGAPLISVDLVQYRDNNGDLTQMTETNDYIVDGAKMPAIIVPPYNSMWPNFVPWPTSSILIRFTSGYALTHPWWSGPGARVKTGMKLLISAWYNNRLPFDKGVGAAAEYPYTVSACLTYGARVRAR